MMRYTTDALVIKETNVGEHDRLITLMTRDLGIISAYAAGAKSIKSKKGSATGLLSYSNITLNKKGDTYRVEEATAIKVFFGAGNDIKILSVCQYLCELSSALCPRESECVEFMRLILNSLHFLTETDRNRDLIKALTELRIMTLIGYAPNLVACDRCGKFEDTVMFFDIQNGSLYCAECKDNIPCLSVEKSALDAMRHIVYSPFERLYSFSLSDSSAEKLSTITEKYLLYQTERNYTTLDFYNSIKNI